MNGKRDNFTLEDFRACAENASMKRGRAEEILQQVQSAILKWRSFARDAGVSDDLAAKIEMAQRTT